MAFDSGLLHVRGVAFDAFEHVELEYPSARPSLYFPGRGRYGKEPNTADGTGPLPDELAAEALEAFAPFADDGGRMNVQHLYAALRSLGVDATYDDVMAVVDEHDPDGHGYVTAGQWTASMARRWAADAARVARFRGLLAAGDVATGRPAGRATVGHVRAVLESFDPAAVTAADVDRVLAAAADPVDGLIDYDRFVAAFVRPPRLNRQQYP